MNSTARGTHTSPNIYTQEISLTSSSSKSLGATTLGLVGETLIGPAFQAIPITSYKEFVTYFGGTDATKYANGYPKYELPYIAKSYLQQSQQLYVTRVLGLSGHKFDGLWALHIYDQSTGGDTVFATIRPKSKYNGEEFVTDVTGVTFSGLSGVTSLDSTFNIVAGISGGTNVTYTVSLNPLRKDYLLKVLGTTPKTNSNSKLYVEEMYEAVVNSVVNGDSITFKTGSTVSGTTKLIQFNNYSSPFRYAKTPWFVSELKGQHVIPLFRLYTLSDGENANGIFKVSIKNVNVDTLTFDLIIRSINDTDYKPVILEQYTNCTLNPADGNSYLGAKIGTVDEVYITKSKYVVVEIADDDRVAESVPMGFEGYESKNFEGKFPVTGSYKPCEMSYNINYEDTGSNINKKTYFGFSDKTGVDMDLFSYKGVTGLTLTKGFHLDSNVETNSIIFTDPNNSAYTCTFDSVTPTAYTNYVVNDIKLMKFTAYFAGGFDGWDIWRENRTNTKDYQFNNYKRKYPTKIGVNFNQFGESDLNNIFGIPNVPTTSGLTSDYYAFWSAVRTFSDPEDIDINVFATPGIDWYNHDTLISEVVDMIENERQDSLYILITPDKPINAGDSKSEMISPDQIVEELEASDIDSSYVATYYPWCQYYDSDNGVYVYLSPTRDVVKNIALTDNTTYAWFPPAGYSRGSVDCIKSKKSLLIDEEDTLYSGRINFIKKFAKDGIKIWGQKTLQITDNSLNRIGVRRMMLYLRKTVRRSNLPLIFEPNDDTTKNKFKDIVNPILNSVKKNRGISNFYTEIDDSIEARERHEMNVKIWIKPIGALEYINIDFMITDEGFDFSTL